MKKLFFLLLLISFTAVSHAQVRLGVRGGMNFSSLPTSLKSGDTSIDAENMDGLTRFYVGAVVDVPFTWRWHMQTGVDFSWMGGKSDGDKMRNTQIQIPALAKVYVVERIPVLAGVYGSYSLSNKIEVDGSKFSLSDLYNKWDFGMQVGAAYEFGFGLFVEFRYLRGFVNQAKDALSQEVEVTTHNQSFQAGIGFRL